LSLEAADLADCDLGSSYARDIKSSLFVPDNPTANILSHYEEQAVTLDKALNRENPWQALATNFPELYEIENALNPDGESEKQVREALLKLLRNQVIEWRAFSGRATLNRYLAAA
jgi:phosphoribosylformylglycinamidine (FGAM) synthase PurS component